MSDEKRERFLRFRNASSTTSSDPHLEQLIEEVRKYPCLYAIYSLQYRDQLRKEECWEDISRTMHTNRNDLKKEWKKLRDCYRQAMVTRFSARNESRKKALKPWKFEEQMEFLKPYIWPRSRHLDSAVDRYSMSSDNEFEPPRVTVKQEVISDEEIDPSQPSTSGLLGRRNSNSMPLSSSYLPKNSNVLGKKRKKRTKYCHFTDTREPHGLDDGAPLSSTSNSDVAPSSRNRDNNDIPPSSRNRDNNDIPPSTDNPCSNGKSTSTSNGLKRSSNIPGTNGLKRSSSNSGTNGLKRSSSNSGTNGSKRSSSNAGTNGSKRSTNNTGNNESKRSNGNQTNNAIPCILISYPTGTVTNNLVNTDQEYIAFPPPAANANDQENRAAPSSENNGDPCNHVTSSIDASTGNNGGNNAEEPRAAPPSANGNGDGNQECITISTAGFGNQENNSAHLPSIFVTYNGQEYSVLPESSNAPDNNEQQLSALQLFFASMYETTKKLPLQCQNNIKMDILEALHKAEDAAPATSNNNRQSESNPREYELCMTLNTSTRSISTSIHEINAQQEQRSQASASAAAASAQDSNAQVQSASFLGSSDPQHRALQLFFASLHESTRNLPLQYQNTVKMSILSTVQRAEEREDEDQD